MNGLEERVAKIEGKLDELSKRIDDLIQAFNHRIDDVNNNVNKRIDHLYTGMTVWFAILTLLIVAFKFLRF